MNEEMKELGREILELKTAKTIPGDLQMYSDALQIPAGKYTGTHRWRITFKDDNDTNPPIVTGYTNNFTKYNATNHTMECFYNHGQNADSYWDDSTAQILASREILSIQMITTPLPLEEWYQVRSFDPSQMGTTPGWCLQNCRKGFGIPHGTYASAMADKNSQVTNGTLHYFDLGSGETPPDYIAVPVYMYTGIPEGHVVVWDHGTIYSDGTIYPSFQSIPGFSFIYGWGELCDGARVVAPY